MYDIFKKPMRQNLKKNQVFYKENGSIYITKFPALLSIKIDLEEKFQCLKCLKKRVMRLTL